MNKCFLFLVSCLLSLVTHSQLIHNVLLIDGTGVAARKASVRIQGNKIIAVGNLSAQPGEIQIDGEGNVLSPGFIDTHSHMGGSLEKNPDAIACLSQGITTIVAGQDGESEEIAQIKSRFLKNPISINLATYAGHTSLREKVMGSQLNRAATMQEIEKMKTLLHQQMKEGALGLSTGLEYAGAYFSSKEEVIELAKVAALYGGRYMSHIRSEDVALKDAITEIIDIGKQAKIPVLVSHIKIALKDDWGSSSELLAHLQAARLAGIDITADCYPYDFWHSTLKVLFPKTDYNNLASAQYAVDHTFDPTGSIVSRFAAIPAYAGKTLAEIADIRKETYAQTLMNLIAISDTYKKANPNVTGLENIMGKSMIESDLINFLKWPNTNICTDGSYSGHPRARGSFTRVLGYFVREKKIMTLPTAIQKMTSLAAEHIGIEKRGLIVPGYYADLVLFNPETVIDQATVKDPNAISKGIEKVWVNGKLVFENQHTTKQKAGIFIVK